MAARKHAILSASSAHRWMNCNPSARLEQEFEDRETEAAAEGTAAHAPVSYTHLYLCRLTVCFIKRLNIHLFMVS